MVMQAQYEPSQLLCPVKLTRHLFTPAVRAALFMQSGPHDIHTNPLKGERQSVSQLPRAASHVLQ